MVSPQCRHPGKMNPGGFVVRLERQNPLERRPGGFDRGSPGRGVMEPDFPELEPGFQLVRVFVHHPLIDRFGPVGLTPGVSSPAEQEKPVALGKPARMPHRPFHRFGRFVGPADPFGRDGEPVPGQGKGGVFPHRGPKGLDRTFVVADPVTGFAHQVCLDRRERAGSHHGEAGKPFPGRIVSLRQQLAGEAVHQGEQLMILFSFGAALGLDSSPRPVQGGPHADPSARFDNAAQHEVSRPEPGRELHPRGGIGGIGGMAAEVTQDRVGISGAEGAGSVEGCSQQIYDAFTQIGQPVVGPHRKGKDHHPVLRRAGQLRLGRADQPAESQGNEGQDHYSARGDQGLEAFPGGSRRLGVRRVSGGNRAIRDRRGSGRNGPLAAEPGGQFLNRGGRTSSELPLQQTGVPVRGPERTARVPGSDQRVHVLEDRTRGQRVQP